MMDVQIAFQDLTTGGDIRLDGADLAGDSTLRTAVILSLFSDARAGADDPLPAGESDPRGWWGDALADVPGDHFGSRLWLLSREKRTEETRLRAESYAREALAWLLEDAVAAALDVTAAWTGPATLVIAIEIQRPNAVPETYRFGTLWKGLTDAV